MNDVSLMNLETCGIEPQRLSRVVTRIEEATTLDLEDRGCVGWGKSQELRAQQGKCNEEDWPTTWRHLRFPSL